MLKGRRRVGVVDVRRRVGAARRAVGRPRKRVRNEVGILAGCIESARCRGVDTRDDGIRQRIRDVGGLAD